MADEQIGRREAGRRLEEVNLPELRDWTQLEPEQYTDESGARFVRVRGVRKNDFDRGAVPEYVDDANFSYEEFEAYYSPDVLNLDLP